MGLKVKANVCYDPERLWVDDVGAKPARIIQTTRLGIPHGRDEQSAKETVILEISHVSIRKKSAGIFSETDAKGTARAVPFIYRGD